MRLLIQRVRRASVTIDGTLHSSIGAGLLLLVGIEEADTQEDIDYLAGKASRLRVFDDEAGVMNLDVRQTAGELLVVSQFTLHASTRKGNRPSYFRAGRSLRTTDVRAVRRGARSRERPPRPHGRVRRRHGRRTGQRRARDDLDRFEKQRVKQLIR